MKTLQNFMKKSDWIASWIWLDYTKPAIISEPFRSLKEQGLLNEEKNRWGLFRKTFILDDDENLQEGKAILKISVDSRYKLWINGNYVGRGIYRCNKLNWYYDEFDVSSHLKHGKNVISVIAQFFGKEMSWYEPMMEGGLARPEGTKGQLIFQIEMGEKPFKKYITSDNTTRGFILQAYEHTLTQSWAGLPYLELFDTHLMPIGWNLLDFDDSGNEWNHVKVLNLGNSWPHMIPCDIPRLEEERIAARSLINAGPVDLYFDEEDIKMSQEPGEEPIDFLAQMAHSGFSSKNDTLIEEYSSSTTVEFNISDTPYGLVFDLGKQRSGFIYFVFETDQEGVELDILWSEKLDESRENLYPKSNPFQFKYGMQYKARAGVNEHEMFHWFGLRYLQLNFTHPQGVHANIKIKEVGIKQYLYPVSQSGFFKCSDDKFNSLFDTCIWTLRNCMHDGYEDCPSREQRQWVGDAYVEIMTNFAVFDDRPLARKLIEQVSQSQRGDGLTFMVTPGDHQIHGVMIPDYCLYYISIVFQYYRHTGDEKIIKRYFPTILKAIKWFLQYVDKASGLFTDCPYMIFIDWSENDKSDANGVINCQLYAVLRQIIKMGQIIGWEKSVKKFKKYSRRIKKGINKYLWNEERNVYVDSAKIIIKDGEKITIQSDRISFHTNSMVLLYDIAPHDRFKAIIKNVFDVPFEKLHVANRNPIWSNITPEKYIEKEHVIMAEPFFMHHVNKMLAKYDRQDIIGRFIRNGWIPMIEQGSTTIWETWSNNSSLCHAWSATPAHDLIRYCLGIRILRPMARIIEISPHPMGLSWAEGSTKTALGIVKVRWEWYADKKKLMIYFSHPIEIESKVVPPIIDNLRLHSVSNIDDLGDWYDGMEFYYVER